MTQEQSQKNNMKHTLDKKLEEEILDSFNRADFDEDIDIDHELPSGLTKDSFGSK